MKVARMSTPWDQKKREELKEERHPSKRQGRKPPREKREEIASKEKSLGLQITIEDSFRNV